MVFSAKKRGKLERAAARKYGGKFNGQTNLKRNGKVVTKRSVLPRDK